MAIGCIDDQIAVLGERLVEVARLWSDILEVIAGEPAEALVLVFPTWWSSARVELVTAAAHNVAAEVVVLQRASVLGADSDATVIEFSEEFVVTAPPGSEVTVLPRGEHDVAAPLGAAGSILVDVPADVSPLGPTLTAQLRAAGIPVAHSDRHRLLRAVTAALPDRAVGDRTGDRPRPSRRTVAVLAGAVLSAAAIGGVGRRRRCRVTRRLTCPQRCWWRAASRSGCPHTGSSSASPPAPDRPGCGCRHPRSMRPPCTSPSPSVRRPPPSPRHPNHSGAHSNSSPPGCSPTSIPPAASAADRGHLSRTAGGQRDHLGGGGRRRDPHRHRLPEPSGTPRPHRRCMRARRAVRARGALKSQGTEWLPAASKLVYRL